MRDEERFGTFLRDMRKERHVSIRSLANHLGISAAYLSDIEHGNRSPFSYKMMLDTAEFLLLSKEEEEQMFDEAAASRGEVAADVIDYIKMHDYVTFALREARRLGATKKDWMQFVSQIQRRRE